MDQDTPPRLPGGHHRTEIVGADGGDAAPRHEVQFFFSYLEVDDVPRDYDLTELKLLRDVIPRARGRRPHRGQ